MIGSKLYKQLLQLALAILMIVQLSIYSLSMELIYVERLPYYNTNNLDGLITIKLHRAMTLEERRNDRYFKLMREELIANHNLSRYEIARVNDESPCNFGAGANDNDHLIEYKRYVSEWAARLSKSIDLELTRYNKHSEYVGRPVAEYTIRINKNGSLSSFDVERTPTGLMNEILNRAIERSFPHREYLNEFPCGESVAHIRLSLSN